MSLIEVKKCEFDTAYINQTVCSSCGHIAEGILDKCPECESILVNHEYNVPQYTIKDNLSNIYVNKDHVIKAVKLEGYREDYYLISLTNGAKLIVDNTDFNTLK